MAPDRYAMGIYLCCAGSVLMVSLLYVGIMGFLEDLVALIALSVLMHVVGLLLVVVDIVVESWRAETPMYYDWGLPDCETSSSPAFSRPLLGAVRVHTSLPLELQVGYLCPAGIDVEDHVTAHQQD